MWTSFVLSSVVLIVLLYLPGSMLAHSLTRSCLDSVAVAPVLSVALFAVFGVILGWLGLSGFAATVLILVVPLIVSALALALLPKIGTRNVEKRHCCSAKTDWALLAAFVAVSVVVSTAFFLKSLDGPASFSQQTDNADHLAKIIEVARDGNYSMLKSSSYSPEYVGTSLVPATTLRYYPNAFHVVTSFLVSLLGVSAPLAENCTLFVFSSFVYPSGMYALLRELFESRRPVLVCGALATASFAAFPLGMMYFGGVYPNVAAFCCVPAVCLLFIKLIKLLSEQMPTRWALLCPVLAFIAACVGAVALQPNAVFTAAVFLMPFCCHKIYSWLRGKFPDVRYAPVLGSLLLGVCFAIAWYALYKAPFMQSVVQFDWPATSGNPVQGFYDVITLSLRYKVPQLLLSLLVLLGIVRAFSDERPRWLAVSFLLMCLFYFAGDSFNSEIKHLLTGFWYTDQWRTAASVAIMGVPLATLGIEACSYKLARAVSGVSYRFEERLCAPVVVLLGAIVIVIFQPQNYIGIGSNTSAFGRVSDNLAIENSLDDSKPYTAQKKEFVERASEIVGDSLVINMPFDGSVWSYFDGTLANPYYRAYIISDESAESTVIRTRLSDIDSDEEVRRAVEATGAEYVLQLPLNSYEEYGDAMWSLHGQFNMSAWSGLTANLDGVSSFELVLQEGDMRLYRINL